MPRPHRALAACVAAGAAALHPACPGAAIALAHSPSANRMHACKCMPTVIELICGPTLLRPSTCMPACRPRRGGRSFPALPHCGWRLTPAASFTGDSAPSFNLSIKLKQWTNSLTGELRRLQPTLPNAATSANAGWSLLCRLGCSPRFTQRRQLSLRPLQPRCSLNICGLQSQRRLKVGHRVLQTNCHMNRPAQRPRQGVKAGEAGGCSHRSGWLKGHRTPQPALRTNRPSRSLPAHKAVLALAAHLDKLLGLRSIIPRHAQPCVQQRLPA